MKSMKKVCALLVCASMAFSVFACSSEAEGKPDRSSDDAEETEVQETNADTSETTSVGCFTKFIITNAANTTASRQSVPKIINKFLL